MNQHTKKTHCLQGHEFTPENTRLARTGERRFRVCRICEQVRLSAQKTACPAPTGLEVLSARHRASLKDAWLDAEINTTDIETRFGVRRKDATALFGSRPSRGAMPEFGEMRRKRSA